MTGIWIDVCDFDGGGSADEVLNDVAWVHVGICGHFRAGGNRAVAVAAPFIKR